MPLVTPALTRSWVCQIDVPARDYSSVKGMTDSFLWMLKEALLGTLPNGTGTTNGTRPANSLWTVVGSSDGVTASLVDGVDRWTSTYTPAKLINAASGTAHSWIILRNATLNSHLLLDYNSATAGQAFIQWSIPAPNSGSVTVSPRCTGALVGQGIAMGTNSDAVGATINVCGDSVFGSGRFHVTVDQFGGFFAFQSRLGGGICSSAVGHARFREGPSGDLAPLFGFATSASSGRGACQTLASLFAPSVFGCRQALSANRVTVGGPSVGNFGSTTPIAMTLDVIDATFLAFEIGVVSNDANQTAFRGYLPDVWACSNNAVGTGQANVTTIIGDLHFPFPIRPTF